MVHTPIVSVIVNCFNGEKYLREALDSVIKQTYADWELIFWDNRSTDDSRLIFQSYDEPRFRYFLAESHSLLYAARNRALALCQGSLICFLDVDDWWVPAKLESQIPFFDDARVGFACGNYWIENELRKTRKKRFASPPPDGQVLDELLADYFVALPTLMVRKSAIDELTYPFNDHYHVIGEFDMVMRLSINWHLRCTKEPVAFYRLHGQNESTKHRELQLTELEHWKSTPEVRDIISHSPNYPHFQSFVNYKKGINAAINHQRFAAIKHSFRLPWGKEKLTLILATLIPNSILRRISQRS